MVKTLKNATQMYRTEKRPSSFFKTYRTYIVSRKKRKLYIKW